MRTRMSQRNGYALAFSATMGGAGDIHARNTKGQAIAQGKTALLRPGTINR